MQGTLLQQQRKEFELKSHRSNSKGKSRQSTDLHRGQIGFITGMDKADSKRSTTPMNSKPDFGKPLGAPS